MIPASYLPFLENMFSGRVCIHELSQEKSARSLAYVLSLNKGDDIDVSIARKEDR